MTQLIQPFTPSEAFAAATGAKIQSIPLFVVKAVNDSIVEALATQNTTKPPNSFSIPLQDIMVKVVANMRQDPQWANVPNDSQGDSDLHNLCYERKWMDIEQLYKTYGWNVVYMKTPYWDSTPNYFNFSLN